MQAQNIGVLHHIVNYGFWHTVTYRKLFILTMLFFGRNHIVCARGDNVRIDVAPFLISDVMNKEQGTLRMLEFGYYYSTFQ